MGIELSPESWQVLVAFACYLAGVAALGIFSHRYLSRGSFVKEYFLGNRGLGPWVLALTIAATAVSGGTFMGFPSLIYSNGWIMALWIASYMVVPLTTMALMGKRINQVARISGAVTVPDVFRDRFNSPLLGIIATCLILLFVTFNLVAQFKGGGLVMKEALKLRPAQAEFVGAAPDAAGNLALRFRLADGREERQTTPLPGKDARYLPERTRLEPADRPEQAIVHFQVGSEVLAKEVRFPPVRVGRTSLEMGYVLGLIIFALTVIAYTTYGGFWAVTWTDVLEGLVMLIGVVLMAVLAIRAVPPVTSAEGAELHGLAAATERVRQQDPQLVHGPGPSAFLPIGLGFSFFLMWSLMSPGQPSGMVRLMSFRDVPSLRRAMVLVSGYYFVTYGSLLVIFICARAIFPTQYLHAIGSEGEPDSIMPAMARYLTPPLGAGLLLAAPYAAIMSTVAAFLLMISSSLVRDLYQRTINPNASERTLKLASYMITGTIGLIVMIGALNPPTFLQYVIVFTATSQGCAFLIPMIMSLYWRRATRQGVLAGMLAGALVVVVLYVLGWLDTGSQRALEAHAQAVAAGQAVGAPPALAQWLQDNLSWINGWGEKRPDALAAIYLFGMDTLVWGMLASLAAGVGVSLATRPDPELTARYFPTSAGA